MTAPGANPYRIPGLSSELRAYLNAIGRPEHPELQALRARTAALPLVAAMQGSPEIAQLLEFLVSVVGAREVIEVGTFTGCTTLALAASVPEGGRVVTIDASAEWPAIGREYWERSRLAGRIDLRIGKADAVLDALVADGRAGTVDLIFVDADKDAYGAYLERALALLREGGVVVFDNVLFGGRVPLEDDDAIRRESPAHPKFLQDLYVRYAAGLRRFNEQIAADDRVDLVVLPMGDGVTLARKKHAC
jgi:O-methyltransferase